MDETVDPTACSSAAKESTAAAADSVAAEDGARVALAEVNNVASTTPAERRTIQPGAQRRAVRWRHNDWTALFVRSTPRKRPGVEAKGRSEVEIGVSSNLHVVTIH